MHGVVVISGIFIELRKTGWLRCLIVQRPSPDLLCPLFEIVYRHYGRIFFAYGRFYSWSSLEMRCFGLMVSNGMFVLCNGNRKLIHFEWMAPGISAFFPNQV